MRYYYAIIDENNIVCEVRNTFKVIEKDNYIPIPEYDDSLLGKYYNGLEFIEVGAENENTL